MWLLLSLLNKFHYHLNEGLKLRCVSLNEQSVGCVGVVVKCVHFIQWTSVSHRATAAEMTHVCQTDFMSLHMRDVQVSADTNSEKCQLRLKRHSLSLTKT